METVDLRNAETALKTCNEVAVLTMGVSMRPLLRQHKDIVIIERIERQLKVGDVPLYRRLSNEPFVLHRILKITPEYFVIRGDNTYTLEYVKPEQFIGVMKSFYRGGHYHDCKTDKGYRVYIMLNRISYPIRYFFKMILRPFLGRTRRKIFGGK